MKLLKYLLASLALIASTAQANIISTDVYIDKNHPVQYVDFQVTDSGDFLIVSNDGFIFDNSKLDPHAILFSNPVSQLNFIAGNDNFLTDDSWIIENLQVGSYVLALSDSYLTIAEAINGYNSDVTKGTKGFINVTIKSFNGEAEFGSPSAVPVPAAAWLFGSALLGFAGFRRKSV